MHSVLMMGELQQKELARELAWFPSLGRAGCLRAASWGLFQGHAGKTSPGRFCQVWDLWGCPGGRRRGCWDTHGAGADGGETREEKNSQKALKEEDTHTHTRPRTPIRAHAHPYAPTHTALAFEGPGTVLIVPGRAAARSFQRSQNSLMRLWPLPVGTLLPGISFDKADGPSGTSYQVFLLNPAVVLLFRGKQRGRSLWPASSGWGGTRAILAPGRDGGVEGDGSPWTGNADLGHRQWVRRGLWMQC